MKSNSWIHSTFHPTKVKHELITFFLETYVELLISAVVAFRVYNFKEVWNKWDYFAVSSQIIGIAAAVAFFIFIFWFVCVK